MAKVALVATEIVRLNAAIAEVLVHVDFDHDVPSEYVVTGRVRGPRCPGAETIEIAYPLRAIPASPLGPRRRSARVVIPEPNLWDVQTPFTYVGVIEVRHGGQNVMALPIEIGLRQGA